jgi:hypothetical protein
MSRLLPILIGAAGLQRLRRSYRARFSTADSTGGAV